MKEDQGFERCSAAQVAIVGMFRPQKSNIDTNTTLAIFEGVTFPIHHLGYPAVSFRGCRSFFILISNGLKWLSLKLGEDNKLMLIVTC